MTIRLLIFDKKQKYPIKCLKILFCRKKGLLLLHTTYV